jgi:hypothetical protein
MNLDHGAIVTLVIFLLTELGVFLWWASGVNTTLDFIKEKLIRLDGFVQKSEYDKDVARTDRKFTEVWERLNKQHACPNANNHQPNH